MQVRFGRESEDACNVHPEESDQNDLQDGFEKWYDTGRNVSMSKMLTLQLVFKWLHYSVISVSTHVCYIFYSNFAELEECLEKRSKLTSMESEVNEKERRN